MIYKYYPSKLRMIEVMEKDLPFKIDFNDSLDKIKECWDNFQSLCKTIPDNNERNKGLVNYLKDTKNEKHIKECWKSGEWI